MTNTTLTAEQVIALPDGALFIEVDITTEPVYIKVRSIENDVVVQPLFDPAEDGAYARFGFDGMDDADRRSRRFYMLTDADRDKVVMRLVGGFKKSS